ncbi:MAG: D-amino-acid transaminase [Candidatus Coatesbacteria bacterium]|nr:D-amino-acid transaminase [Candidatus Coatesbacteria bacterium]
MMIAYFNGELFAKDKVRISPDDRGFLFADGIYEAVRSFHGKLFRTRDHIQRLERSAREMRFERTEFGELAEVAERLIAENNLLEGSAFVYIQVTRGAAPRSHKFPPKDTALTVYADARPFPSNDAELESGASAILAPDIRWARCDIKTVALLPNTLAHQRAREAGAVEAIFVRNGAVQEGTHSNVFIVSKGELLTPPLCNYILAGITRQAVLEICEKLSIPCRSCTIFEEDLREAEEMFIAGTTVDITPIVCLDGRKIGPGTPGPVTRRLQNAYVEATGR